ncbi:MAG: glycosyltransferase family 4 protein [Geobacter sp.]|nr:glycosyltransferase family 4 protein [Geobacter sp.]
MRIVFLAPFGIRPKGSLQARMLPLAKELQRIGHDLVIIAPPYTNPEDSGLVEVVEGVTLRNIRLGPTDGPLAAPFIAWRMLRAALDQQPDLIHLFKPKGYGGLACMALNLIQAVGAQTCIWVVDSDDREGKGGMNDLHPYSWPEKRLFSLQEQWLTRWAGGVTVASRSLESLAWGMGARPATTLYLPNGPVLRQAGSREQGRRRFGFDARQPVLLLYTRFFEFDQQRLYAVLEQLCKRMPQMRLLVVGKGRQGEEQALEQVADQRGWGEQVTIAGWVRPEQLPDCLAAADAALYLFDDTLINRTKCPAKLAELAACGIPIAVERVGQVPEYLQHGESGLLVESGDVTGLVQAAQQLLTDRALAERIGQAARQRMLTVFGWEQRAEELDQFYQQVAVTC